MNRPSSLAALGAALLSCTAPAQKDAARDSEPVIEVADLSACAILKSLQWAVEGEDAGQRRLAGRVLMSTPGWRIAVELNDTEAGSVAARLSTTPPPGIVVQRIAEVSVSAPLGDFDTPALRTIQVACAG